MDKFLIQGGTALRGEIAVSGAKNASLALLAATLLNSGINTISNTPRLNDVSTMLKLLAQLGCGYTFTNNIVTIDSVSVDNQFAPYELVKKMRASIYVLGPLLARYGYAKVSLPGGCAWGPRPVNLHIEGLRKMGAELTVENGYIIAKTKRLQAAKLNFDISSVGATGNLLMASVLASGTTVINNAAMEPEITNLALYLQNMGAKISGIGTPILEIEGVDELHPADIETIPDRIEAGTILIAAAITKGTVTLQNVPEKHLHSIVAKLQDAGADVKTTSSSITIDAANCSLTPQNIITSPFPGFPTDMQAQWIALMSVTKGTTTVTDSIYLDRFSHVPELNRLGADIMIKENNAIIRGVKKLTGAKVMSTDLRASASLVLAGLAAEGETEVLRVYHLDRGYESLEKKLSSLGANITRVAGTEY
ncbi:MAG: UDP-N-acetylglucosamine 1-carboxyvinyltransferase [Ignavibacteriales bacterium]|nr:UDP-N-acetylglucosamine 1-carboxyvinyltransferase [Ignavibacteriales bacterium]